VALQAEVSYVFGKATKWEGNPTLIGKQDADLSGLAAWIDATADLGRFYVGGSVANVSGDDYSTKDKVEGGGNQSGGAEWKPCLIMFNSDLTYWAGIQAGHGTSANSGPMTNAYFAQLRAGYFFTGDYYKGTSDANSLSNDYLVLNKLTLVF